MIKIPVSYGELVDKLTILAIKSDNISNKSKLSNIRAELELLSAEYTKLPMSGELIKLREELQNINQKIWEIEDAVRDCEKRRDFSEQFIELARSVYLNNDERAQIKRKINDLLSSDIVEEKSYTEYK